MFTQTPTAAADDANAAEDPALGSEVQQETISRDGSNDSPVSA